PTQEVQEPSDEIKVGEPASIAKLDPPVCTASIFGQCLLSKRREDKTGAAASKGVEPEAGAEKTDTVNAKADGSKETPSATEQRPATEPEEVSGMPAPADAGADGIKETPSANQQPPAAQPKEATGKTSSTNAEVEGETLSADVQPQAKTKDQTDDLLSPTPDELRVIKNAEEAARHKGLGGESPGEDSNTTASEPQTGAAPTTGIESNLDAESWAEYGGWYRQDYAIYYRPTGHKDKFIYTWLSITGPLAPKGDTSPAAA